MCLRVKGGWCVKGRYQWLWHDMVQKLWCHLLIVTSYKGNAVTFCAIVSKAEPSKGRKMLTIS